MRWLHLKQNNQSDFKFVLSNRSNCRKIEDKEYHVANFATFVSKTLTFPPPPPQNGWIKFPVRLSTASIKYLKLPSPVFGWFQNGCDKAVIEPRVIQFWSEIILVISNRTRFQIALVWFWNHVYDFSPNCTPLSSITIINSTLVLGLND